MTLPSLIESLIIVVVSLSCLVVLLDIFSSKRHPVRFAVLCSSYFNGNWFFHL